MAPITDKLIDQLSDEMREYARSLRSEGRSFVEEDDAKANFELADMLEDVATVRPLLVRFAFLLRSHSNRASALAEITGAQVSA